MRSHQLKYSSRCVFKLLATSAHLRRILEYRGICLMNFAVAFDSIDRISLCAMVEADGSSQTSLPHVKETLNPNTQLRGCFSNSSRESTKSSLCSPCSRFSETPWWVWLVFTLTYLTYTDDVAIAGEVRCFVRNVRSSPSLSLRSGCRSMHQSPLCNLRSTADAALSRCEFARST